MLVRLWSPTIQIVGVAIASLVVADSEGTYLWNPPYSNEANGYARVIELQHAGDRNGRLIATWEHWYTESQDSGEPNGVPGSFIIRESKDGGNTWSTSATLTDQQSGSGHPCVRFWQPFLLEFPRPLGQYPEGTLILVGVLMPLDSSYSSFFMWRSLDHGKTWSPAGEWQRGGTFLHGIWEPLLFIDSENKLVAIFSDERHDGWSQAIARMTSGDGGDSWSNLDFVVSSSNAQDRPGMATVAKMDNGQYALAYEYCGTTNCQIYVKNSDNGLDWDPLNMGDAISTTDGFYPASSPFMVWEPIMKLLILSSSTAYSFYNDSLVSESSRAVFINNQYGQGQWRWSPTPWNVQGRSDTCRSNYSPNLLARTNGKIRLTAAASEGKQVKCSERTGEAFIGVLPYQANLSVDGQSGWINFGGDWSVSGNEYGFASIQARAAIAVTGSTGWTIYTITSDIMITSTSGQAGVMIHIAAAGPGVTSSLGPVQGFTFTLEIPTGKMVIRQEGAKSTLLYSGTAPFPVQSNKWYRLSLGYRSDGKLAITFGGTRSSGPEESGPDVSYTK